MKNLPENIDDFLEFLSVQKNYSHNTVRSYSHDLYEFFYFYALYKGVDCESKNEVDLLYASDVDVIAIRGYLGKLYKKENKKSSVARKLSCLRSFFSYLVKYGSVKENPADQVMTPRQDKPVPGYLTVDDIFRLIDSVNTRTILGIRNKAILELMYSTGIRVSEVSGLNRGDIDSDKGIIRVTGKGNKQRVVPVGLKALEAVEKYRKKLNYSVDSGVQSKTPVFLNKNGGRLSTRSIGRMLDQAAASCGLAVPVSPHDIRHTFATHMLDAGADLRGVQEILGHESLSTTQKYTHVTIDRLTEAYDKAHPRK